MSSGHACLVYALLIEREVAAGTVHLHLDALAILVKLEQFLGHAILADIPTVALLVVGEQSHFASGGGNLVAVLQCRHGIEQTILSGDVLGLLLFVGIPLPGTGGWTGSLAASLMEMKFSKAIVAIFLGILMATVIMSIVSYGLLGMIIR